MKNITRYSTEELKSIAISLSAAMERLHGRDLAAARRQYHAIQKELDRRL